MLRVERETRPPRGGPPVSEFDSIAFYLSSRIIRRYGNVTVNVAYVFVPDAFDTMPSVVLVLPLTATRT